MPRQKTAVQRFPGRPYQRTILLLTNKQEFSALYEITRLQPIKIRPARHALGIKYLLVFSRIAVTFYQQSNLLSQHIENLQGNKARFDEVIFNHSCWVERVGVSSTG